MAHANNKGKVCVTGGTGFLGSWLVKTLLEDGYTVNTTVRFDPSNLRFYKEIEQKQFHRNNICADAPMLVFIRKKRDISFLTKLSKASEKLKVFNADLSKPESFNEAIEGCMGVFHVASPIDFAVKEAEETVTKRSIDGALGILKACKNSKTVKRVVYTSSGSAVCCKEESEEEEEDGFDESSWSDVEFLRKFKPFCWSYAVSKTLTEKAMLQFGENNALEVVSLIAPLIVGPFISPKLPDSVEKGLVLVLGKKDKIGITRFHMAHVDDVVRAHIFLLEHPNPKGRYICSPFSIDIQEMAKILSAMYPEFEIPEIKGFKLPRLISNKLMDAGFEFKNSIEDMFKDAIECCVDKGFL
ncbi:vestitone reductase-like [Arachis ipaensis]|uniref:vestitone reductase-like n=1 Tax=Arachis ipaensis TaxID=130454 RepID=UPI000A2B7A48|nr:vestitone reductase-like [Arachis ipaensis]